MRICIDMDTLRLVAYHTDGNIRDGLAQLQGTASHFLRFEDSESDGFLSQLTTLELDTFIRNVLGNDFDVAALDDDDKRFTIAAYCDALEAPKVNLSELEAQIECVEEFLELDPNASPQFRYVYGAYAPLIVDENLTMA